MVDVKNDDKDYLNAIEIKTANISAGMKNITIAGRIKEIYKTFTFNRNDGTEGRVGSFLLCDESGEIRVVLWDDDTKLFSQENFKKNEIVKILNGYAKEGRDKFAEIHLGRLGKIILCPEDIDYKRFPKITDQVLNINKVNVNLRTASVSGKIIRISPIKDFNKKDGTPGRVSSITLMDSTGTIRIVFWNEDIEKIKSIQVGDVISLSQLSPKLNNFNSNSIELVANSETKLVKNKNQTSYEAEVATNLKELQKRENLVSFKGVITSVSDLKIVNLNSGEQVPVLNFEVSDSSDYIRITAWREKAEELSTKLTNNMTLFLKNLQLRFNERFERKEATYLSISELEEIEEKIPIKLRTPSKKNQNSTSFKRDFVDINSIDSVGMVEIKGSIIKELDIDKNELFLYEACPNCSKKLTNCTCPDKKPPVKKIILKLMIDDETGTIRTTFFGEKAEKLIGKNADEIASIPDLTSIIKDLGGKQLILKGKVGLNSFNDINRYELNVYDFKEVNYTSELDNVMQDISSLE
jgi:replication factor A1